MLPKEFKERTGLSLSADEYAKVDALYLACGDDIDKDEFCRLYMSFDGRLELLHRIERQLQRALDCGYELEKRLKALEANAGGSCSSEAYRMDMEEDDELREDVIRMHEGW